MESNVSGIPVGISTCLLGKEVRHDGGHKHSRYCTQVLSKHFDFRSICPELEAGLGVPRPAIHLREYSEGLRLIETKGAADHTDAMQGFIDQVMPTLADLRGYILMAKSPSCGMERIKVHNEDGNVIRRDGRGMFAEALLKAYPLMPVEEEGRLNDDMIRENFIERVFAYDDWMQNVAGDKLSAQALIEFHTRHKFQLLAHSERIYRQLGPMLGDLKSEPLEAIAERYIHQFMEAMSKKVSRGSHMNAMQHLMGYLRDSMGDEDRKVLMEPVDYLHAQQYLTPYPDELGLRNNV
jgi:uncharacterized protein YbbK (DUF523 family)/uncharacterized protein YbgA (DUF1722 family)